MSELICLRYNKVSCSLSTVKGFVDKFYYFFHDNKGHLNVTYHVKDAYYILRFILDIIIIFINIYILDSLID